MYEIVGNCSGVMFRRRLVSFDCGFFIVVIIMGDGKFLFFVIVV